VPSELPIVLDGSTGEGGGQILRTALSLSAITGKPFSIDRIRANRDKAGLRPQHREAARAVARLCDAQRGGDEVGSARLDFRPRRRVQPGDWAFDIGTAGSTPLCSRPSAGRLLSRGHLTLTLRGGAPDHAPSFHYLALVWGPRSRGSASVQLARRRRVLSGGRRRVQRARRAGHRCRRSISATRALQDVEVFSMVCGLGFDVAERQAARALRLLREVGISAQAERVPMPSRASRGGHVLVVSTFQRGRAGHGAVSVRERSPEQIAEEAVGGFRAYLEGGAAVDRHLGDQLLMPAALIAAGLVPAPPGIVPSTRYTVDAVTKHLTTNAEVIRRFLDVEIAIVGRQDEEGEVRVQPPGAGAEIVPLQPAEG
jgi:RNA 3'-terminal phosphate cyclase (ATP)